MERYRGCKRLLKAAVRPRNSVIGETKRYIKTVVALDKSRARDCHYKVWCARTGNVKTGITALRSGEREIGILLARTGNVKTGITALRSGEREIGILLTLCPTAQPEEAAWTKAGQLSDTR